MTRAAEASSQAVSPALILSTKRSFLSPAEPAQCDARRKVRRRCLRRTLHLAQRPSPVAADAPGRGVGQQKTPRTLIVLGVRRWPRWHHHGVPRAYGMAEQIGIAIWIKDL